MSCGSWEGIQHYNNVSSILLLLETYLCCWSIGTEQNFDFFIFIHDEWLWYCFDLDGRTRWLWSNNYGVWILSELECCHHYTYCICYYETVVVFCFSLSFDVAIVWEIRGCNKALEVINNRHHFFSSHLFRKIRKKSKAQHQL